MISAIVNLYYAHHIVFKQIHDCCKYLICNWHPFVTLEYYKGNC